MSRFFRLKNFLRRNRIILSEDLLGDLSLYLRLYYEKEAPSEYCCPDKIDGIPEGEEKDSELPRADAVMSHGNDHTKGLYQFERSSWKEDRLKNRIAPRKMILARSAVLSGSEHDEIGEYIESQQKPSFSRTLMMFIDERNERDSDVYRRARIDRRLFSKIRSDEGYHPSQDTVISLALALRLSRGEADTLLETAGYALSKSRLSDLVVAFCIEREIFNVCDVNMILDHLNLPLIGYQR